MKKITLIGVVILAGAMGVAYFLLTPKGEINMQKAESSSHISAVDLFSDFMNDEAIGNQKYSGKVISVSGKLNKVDRGGDGAFTLWLETGMDDGQVVCNMEGLDSITLKGLAIGQALSIKGICTGYLFDVVIDKAIIDNSK